MHELASGMLDPVVAAVEAIQVQRTRTPREPSMFSYRAGEDGYARSLNLYEGTSRICNITQSVGHCCAATMVGSLTPYGFWEKKTKVNDFIADMKRHWKQQQVFLDDNQSRLSLFNISGFYVLLSPETAGFDKALRNHPDIVKVHSFKNKRSGPRADYSFTNTIDLYFMEF